MKQAFDNFTEKNYPFTHSKHPLLLNNSSLRLVSMCPRKYKTKRNLMIKLERNAKNLDDCYANVEKFSEKIHYPTYIGLIMIA